MKFRGKITVCMWLSGWQCRHNEKSREEGGERESTTVRIEIAFLSCKASMSDSIELIYLAAKADPDCDAYWIPVPYFDRNPDGSHGDVHYEGAGFYGKNIECTNWRKYDIEAWHPDVIFTFNPLRSK